MSTLSEGVGQSVDEGKDEGIDVGCATGEPRIARVLRCAPEAAAAWLAALARPGLRLDTWRVVGDRRASPEAFAAVEQAGLCRCWIEAAGVHHALGGECDHLVVVLPSVVGPAWLDWIAAVLPWIRAGGEWVVVVESSCANGDAVQQRSPRSSPSSSPLTSRMLAALADLELRAGAIRNPQSGLPGAPNDGESSDTEQTDAMTPALRANDSWTLGQRRLIEAVHRWWAGRESILMVTGVRGSGKSTAVAAALAQIASGIETDTPARRNDGAPWLWLAGVTATACRRLQNEFVARSGQALAELRLSERASRGERALPVNAPVVIDEASMLPAATLLAWSVSGRRLCLIATGEGYEGSGQGLATLVMPELDQAGIAAEVVELRESRRWLAGDALEMWFDDWFGWPGVQPGRAEAEGPQRRYRGGRHVIRGRAQMRVDERSSGLCDALQPGAQTEMQPEMQPGAVPATADPPWLDSTTWAADSTNRAAPRSTPREMTFERREADAMALDEDARVEWLGLLHAAHYRSRLSDWWRWVDDSATRFWGLRVDGRLVAAALTQDEPGLSPALATAVFAGERRPQGAKIGGQFARLDCRAWAGLPARRIVRVAVCPDLQMRGFGSALLEALRGAAQGDGIATLGVQCGHERSLLAFWRRAGFDLLRLGGRPDPMTGRRTMVLVAPLNAAARREQQRWERRAGCHWAFWLRGQGDAFVGAPDDGADGVKDDTRGDGFGGGAAAGLADLNVAPGLVLAGNAIAAPPPADAELRWLQRAPPRVDAEIYLARALAFLADCGDGHALSGAAGAFLRGISAHDRARLRSVAERFAGGGSHRGCRDRDVVDAALPTRADLSRAVAVIRSVLAESP